MTDIPDKEAGEYTYLLVRPDNVDQAGMRLRKNGFSIRDTLQIVGPDWMKFAVLAQKNYQGSNTENVIREGVGVLDIDRSRIASCGDHKRPEQPTNNSRDIYGEQSSFQPTNAEGRFPTNTILVHHPDCERTGVREVKSGMKGESEGGWENANIYGNSDRRSDLGGGYADEDGKETVDNWDCHETCPVGLLDRQSFEMGIHGAGHQTGGQGHTTGDNESMFCGDHRGNGARYGDKGGASRFFQQCQSRKEVISYLDTLIDQKEHHE